MADHGQIKRLVIAGGGTAGWMTAALMSKIFGRTLDIQLVESEAIGTVGVGEATIPAIQVFNKLLQLDEAKFLKATNGSIKLAIEFQNWGKLGDSYMHGFGYVGRNAGAISFQHLFIKCLQAGSASDLSHYSLNNMAAKAGKFAPLLKIDGSPLSGLAWAYHFDAALYAALLRDMSETAGVKRIEGKITTVNKDGESGAISSLTMEDGTKVEGDFFVDCSGFRGLLIEDSLEAGFEDWTHWLPCDRAIAVPSSNENAPLRPFTQSIARTAGWQWRIPLQHRTGNGHVFSSDHMSEDEATAILLDNLEGKPLKDPMTLRFKTGRRSKLWHKNCVAIGLSSGFIEPLESTSIHLIQVGITNLLKLFPLQGAIETQAAEYNRRMVYEYESIRDFIILHYHQNARTDSAFWTQCREMSIPDTLAQKMKIFKQTGHLLRIDEELFTEAGWLQVMIGQGLIPENYNPIADTVSQEDAQGYLDGLNTLMSGAAKSLPTHADFIRRHCPAPTV